MWTYMYISFGFRPRNGISDSQNMHNFSFSKYSFPIWPYTFIHLHAVHKILVASYPHTHLVFFSLFCAMPIVLMGNSLVRLRIFHTLKDYMYILFYEMSFQNFAHFLVGFLFLFKWLFMGPLYILDVKLQYIYIHRYTHIYM